MIHATAITTADAISPMTLPETHPQLGPSLTPMRRTTSHPDSRTAASQLTRPGVRTGDSGTST